MDQGGLRLPALGDIAQDHRMEFVAADGRLRDGGLKGEDSPISSPAAQRRGRLHGAAGRAGRAKFRQSVISVTSGSDDRCLFRNLMRIE